MIEIPSKAEFRAWLAERPTETIGYAWRPTKCPVARWLSQRTGGPVSVADCLYVGDGRLPWSECPTWMDEFVTRIDNLYDGSACDGDFCISILDQCE